MEERIIKDEYGRGIRLKKTEDGFVDVTDELAEENLDEEAETPETDEEVVFEFPEITEDDEELAALMPEQAEELKRKREEEKRKKQAEYAILVEQGEQKLAAEDFKGAEESFNAAMPLLFERKEAAVGLWKAKTENFKNPDVLPEYYVEFGEDGLDEFVYDAGKEAVEELKKEYGNIFENRLKELKEEKKPIEKEVLSAQEERREILSARKKKRLIAFLATLVPSVLLLIVGIVCLARVNSRPDQLLLYVALGVFVGFALVFAAFIGAANKFINTLRIIRENEDLSSTEDGAVLVQLLQKEQFYLKLLQL